VGEQTVSGERPPKASEGRVEYDETGASLTECVEGPSQAGKSSETCEMPEEKKPAGAAETV
ncbi:MAG: hypothetical protein ABFE07_11145, partial [Armatimonadia bacterium]